MSRLPLFKHSPIVVPLKSRMPKLSLDTSQQEETPSLPSEYLSQTAGPSQYIQDPSSSRKLLVLDLNGTLLLRPKHRPKAKDSSVRSARPTHPRPYIPSFREYISHPKTTSWLDTMVWSSAQPHSVKEMVEKCFGHKTCLKALLARDMFGLDPELYAKKTPTTKDLSIIWNASTFTSSPSLASLISDNITEDPPKISHSAATTVLLDDSPRKARLQPWNHICIQEYDKGLRKADLDVWESLKVPSNKPKKTKRTKPSTDAAVAEVESVATELVPTTPKGKYEETLLAVIGVLEALKHQSNVAAWIRDGGLLKTGTDEPLPDSGTMWFNNAEVANRWTEKGRSALNELGIDIESGVRG
ncbi:hypothetical protein VNI00_012645 [Paramarasmius palmivorus]|uniref:Mitochondrial import inner membrane translocase subunit TIM50 n=1 Tax=Paramarasmius palmivorus TaxID=297713 RepID=A0AAW0C2F0_9AGAR